MGDMPFSSTYSVVLFFKKPIKKANWRSWTELRVTSMSLVTMKKTTVVSTFLNFNGQIQDVAFTYSMGYFRICRQHQRNVTLYEYIEHLENYIAGRYLWKIPIFTVNTVFCVLSFLSFNANLLAAAEWKVYVGKTMR